MTRPCRSLVALVALVALLGACRSVPEGEDDSQDPSVTTAASAAPLAPLVEGRGSLDLLGELWRCEVHHQGLFLDFGRGRSSYRRGYDLAPSHDEPSTEHAGADFEAVTERRTSYELWSTEEHTPAELTARIRAGRARRVYFRLDGDRRGSARLPDEGVHVVRLGRLNQGIGAGRHSLQLSFTGSGPEPAYVELDWLRLGSVQAPVQSYFAPTWVATQTDVVLGGQPRRSLALPSGASVRCSMVPGANEKLELSFGIWGAGEGKGLVRVLHDREPPRTLLARELSPAGWQESTVDLGAERGQLVTLELVAETAEPTSKIAFGEPRLVYAAPRAAISQARTAVLIVMSALGPQHLAPGTGLAATAKLGRFARRAVGFTAYRGPSTVPAANVASMLTGLPPAAHALADPAARLPDAVRTVAEQLKEVNVRTAMFTGVPTTFEAFGFDAGWDAFEMVSPIVDQPAEAPLLRAARWLERSLAAAPESRRLVVIHARGVHPPWDVSKADAAKLPPADYDGLLDPRRGGIVLRGLRARRRGVQALDDGDWTRLRALEGAALRRQDAAFGEILRVLGAHDALEDALIAIIGDVGAGGPGEVPYAPDGAVAEARVRVPLLMKFPGDQTQGREIATPVSAEDVAVTLLKALGIDEPPGLGAWGLDLSEVAAHDGSLLERAQVAARGADYATWLGPYRLSGRLGRRPSLCRLDVDPACTRDLFDEHPLAARASWQATERVLSLARGAPWRSAEREPAGIDPVTGAALEAWGDIP